MTSTPIRLVAGLGNPGRQYAGTRHNAGFAVLDRLAAHWQSPFSSERKWRAEVARAGTLVLVKPQTFMNLSGEAVGAVAGFYQIPPSQCLIVFDDKDLPLGRLRLRLSGSAGGHNGMRSIIAHLGTEAVPRLRFGIGAPVGGRDPVDHVLGAFNAGEQPLFEKRLDRAVEAINYALRAGLAGAMNVYNRNEELPPSDQTAPADPPTP